jgi:hypothetical protein
MRLEVPRSMVRHLWLKRQHHVHANINREILPSKVVTSWRISGLGGRRWRTHSAVDLAKSLQACAMNLLVCVIMNVANLCYDDFVYIAMWWTHVDVMNLLWCLCYELCWSVSIMMWWTHVDVMNLLWWFCVYCDVVNSCQCDELVVMTLCILWCLCYELCWSVSILDKSGKPRSASVAPAVQPVTLSCLAWLVQL